MQHIFYTDSYSVQEKSMTKVYRSDIHVMIHSNMHSFSCLHKWRSQPKLVEHKRSPCVSQKATDYGSCSHTHSFLPAFSSQYVQPCTLSTALLAQWKKLVNCDKEGRVFKRKDVFHLKQLARIQAKEGGSGESRGACREEEGERSYGNLHKRWPSDQICY